ncbi:MAG: Surface presentation of antigens protein SpaR [Chlamydiae bacterium]|nr:Surface presentation of antigens protein SpaR [Chlamydiota bacterium]
MENFSYSNLFTNLPIGNLVALMLLVFLRIIPIIIMVPFMGGRLLPAPMKMGLSLFLTLFLVPYLAPMNAESLAIGFQIIPLSLKELTIGFMIGLLGMIPFNVATSAGAIIDHQRGSSSLMVTDPTMTTQTSPIGTLLNQLLIVSFFMIGGIHLFFETLLVSFQRIPIETFISPLSFNMNIFWKTAIGLMSTLFSLAIRFAAPSLIAMLMADIFLGIANRLAPQVQIAFLGMPLKSLLGLILLFIGFNFIMMNMEKEALLWFRKMYDLFKTFPIPSS